MTTREREERAEPHPALEEFAISVVRKPTDVRSNEWLTRQTQVQRHRDRHIEVRPVGAVVTGPSRAVALTTDEVGAGEDEWSFVRIGGHDAFARGADHLHAVDIVVAVVRIGATEFRIRTVDIGLRHGLGFNIEHRWFVHVVPHAVDTVGHEVFVEPRPPVADILVEVIREHTHAGPDLAVVDVAVLVADPRVMLMTRVGDEVPFLVLDTRINHPDIREPLGIKPFVESLGIGKLFFVECKDAVLVHVIDVHPDHIRRELAVAELLDDFFHTRVRVV